MPNNPRHVAHSYECRAATRLKETILDNCFTSLVSYTLPEDHLELVQQQVLSNLEAIRYYRISVPLSALVEGDLFNIFIKTGKIDMLSEGRPGVDPLFSLREGILRLELPKELYERAGLVGKPIHDGGRKHVKTRFCIEINLRLPSMVNGKKGFERIRWAFKNVLTDPIVWLFRDCNQKTMPIDAAQTIHEHHPIPKTVTPTITHYKDILIPPLSPPPADSSTSQWTRDEDVLDILEWLGLLTLNSPRLVDGDNIDAYLCRYDIPNREKSNVGNVATLRWRGFVPESWVRKLFSLLWVTLVEQREAWFTLLGVAMKTEAVEGRDGWAVLMAPEISSLPPPAARESNEMEVDEEEEVTKGMDKKGQADEETKEETSGQRDFLLWELINGVDPR